MHFNALFLLCAFLAACSELAAYPRNEYRVQRRSLRRALRDSDVEPLVRRRVMKHISESVEHSAEVHVPEVHVPEVHVSVPEVNVPVPEVHVAEQEDNIPVEKHVDFDDEPEVFVHEAPSKHEHENEIFPSESEVFEETHVSPATYEELPLVEEPVVHESTPKAEGLAVLYDYIYPMVLRKCLSNAIHSAMGSNSEDNHANYNHQMKYIDHPLVQISGLDTLEELRKNLTVVAAARRFSRLPKMTSGCVFHFNEIDADIQAAKEELLASYAESLSEETFRLDNKFILKHESIFKKEFMMHLIIRKLYELLNNHASIYELMHALDADLEKYIKYWNAKH